MTVIDSKSLKVTLVRSKAGRSESVKRTLRSLGLVKIGSSKVLPNVNPILGQINKVIQLVRVEAASEVKE